MKKVPVPTVTVAGVCVQPVVLVALQVAALMTATLFALGPNGTYMVRVAVSTTGGPGNLPTVIVGRLAEQPAVWCALQAAVSITETVSEDGSEAYRVCVAGSKDCVPMLASGSAIGMAATGAQPDTWAALQVAASITSIRDLDRFPAYTVPVAGSTAKRNSWSGAVLGRIRQPLDVVALQLARETALMNASPPTLTR